MAMLPRNTKCVANLGQPTHDGLANLRLSSRKTSVSSPFDLNAQSSACENLATGSTSDLEGGGFLPGAFEA